MSPKITELKNSVGRLFEQRAELNARASFWMKIILGVFSASAIAAQFWSAAGSATPWSLANIVGVGLAGIILLISLYLAAFERDASAVIEDARKALILAEDAEGNHQAALRALDGFDIDQRRMNELYNAILRMRESYRQFLVTAGPVRRRRLWADGRSAWR